MAWVVRLLFSALSVFLQHPLYLFPGLLSDQRRLFFLLRVYLFPVSVLCAFFSFSLQSTAAENNTEREKQDKQAQTGTLQTGIYSFLVQAAQFLFVADSKVKLNLHIICHVPATPQINHSLLPAKPCHNRILERHALFSPECITCKSSQPHIRTLLL